MKDLSELFWGASVEEIKRGYVYQEATGEYVCLICGKTFEKGIIYTADNILYEAEKFAAVHIAQEHSSMFDYLLNMNKKFTGLTDLQKNLLNYFYQGYSDSEIVDTLGGGGSTSTIRNHRFSLREKEKQAKVFLAIMELLESGGKKNDFITIHRSATMVDQRYAITEDENEKILRSYFKEGLDGQIYDFPTKEKRKLVILKHIMKRFEIGRRYSEKEVNEILATVFHDYVTLRRYLIEYGFMDRKADGSEYWVKI